MAKATLKPTLAFSAALGVMLATGAYAQQQGGQQGTEGGGNAAQTTPTENCMNVQPGTDEAKECEAQLRGTAEPQTKALSPNEATVPTGQETGQGAPSGQGQGAGGGGTGGSNQ